MSTTPAIEAAVGQVSQLLHRQIGLRPDPALRSRLRRSIREQASVRGQDLEAYLDTVMISGDTRQDLINAVTVQETSFFRHPEHFELLARDILPALDQPVTLWSAACSNGQEAFSLAMLLDEQGVDGSVIASDLSTTALQRTTTARYTAREVSGLSPGRIARYLTPTGGAWQINKPLRERVRTRQHNLLDALPPEVRGCQVIFCRNVLIYLSPDYATAFLDRVADALPTASLFLGAAETMWQLSDRFDTVRTGDTFSYRGRPEVANTRVQTTHKVAGSHSRPERPGDTRRGTALNNHTGKPTTSGNVADGGKTRFPGRPTPAPPAEGPPAQDDSSLALQLGRAGQLASAAGDSATAVVAFRKCAYLTPHDPMAHLHLGLALETAGDRPSAQRAYAAARHALIQTDAALIEHATEGYTTADLIRLLDSKQQV